MVHHFSLIGVADLAKQAVRHPFAGALPAAERVGDGTQRAAQLIFRQQLKLMPVLSTQLEKL